MGKFSERRHAVGAEVDEPSIAGTLGLDGERRRVAREVEVRHELQRHNVAQS